MRPFYSYGTTITSNAFTNSCLCFSVEGSYEVSVTTVLKVVLEPIPELGRQCVEVNVEASVVELGCLLLLVLVDTNRNSLRFKNNFVTSDLNDN